MTTSFCGIRTFLKTPYQQNFDADYQIIGMPTDALTSYRAGSRFGPGAIREASMMLTDGSIHPKYGIDPRNAKSIVDFGDVEIDVNNNKGNLEILEQLCLKCKHPIVLGGDHSLTYATIRAASKKCEQPINVLHFDAHCDLWKGELNHGTVFTHLIEEGYVDTLTQIGIRSSEPNHYRDLLEAPNTNIFRYSARKIFLDSNAIFSIPRKLLENIKQAPLYLSFDIDCLDPSEAPGTGTPESAGLHMWQVLEMLECLGHFPNWVGMDLVEVSPQYDISGITAMNAANIIWTYLCMKK